MRVWVMRCAAVAVTLLMASTSTPSASAMVMWHPKAPPLSTPWTSQLVRVICGRRLSPDQPRHDQRANHRSRRI